MDLKILGLMYFLILKVFLFWLYSEKSLTWHSQITFASILTPRYLSLYVRYSVLPHSLIFKSPSNFFCLDLKITISVFLILREILFALSQLTR